MSIIGLPDSPVVQNENTNEESGQSPASVPHETCSIGLIRGHSQVNDQSNVVHGQKNDENQPDNPRQRFMNDLY